MTRTVVLLLAPVRLLLGLHEERAVCWDGDTQALRESQATSAEAQAGTREREGRARR